MQINRVYLPHVGSTNTWAKEHGEALNKQALTIIEADYQTAGRGRFKRLWASPPGCNLYATYVFFIPHLPADIGNLPQVLALAVYQALSLDVNVKIKWPNDLVVQGKKLGGILCELSRVKEAHEVVIGLGLNINMPEELLEGIGRPATSLLVEKGDIQNRVAISENIHQIFYEYLPLFLRSGFAPFLEAFKKAIIHQKNDPIAFTHLEKKIEGFFEKINEDGTLSLRHADGSLERYVSGEIG